MAHLDCLFYVGRRCIHGEDSNFLPGTNVYNVIADMGLSRFVSGRFQTPEDCDNCLSFTHFLLLLVG